MKDLKFKKYLSETLVMESLTSKPHFKVSLDCPTGGGKSYYILTYLRDSKIPFTFIAPTTFLADQLSNAYGIACHHSANPAIGNPDQVITVQNHIQKFLGNGILIIDESHTLVSDYGYRSSTIETNLTYGSCFNRILLLSGTPVLSKDEFYEGFQTLKASLIQPQTRTLTIVPYKDWLGATVKLVMESKAKGLTPVISMLDKSEGLSNLKLALAKSGLTDIATINSETKDGEQILVSTHYDDLINGREIKADAIITTYTDGYSMYGTNYSLIIVPSKNRHSYLAIVQMMARFREMETFDAYLLSRIETLTTSSIPYLARLDSLSEALIAKANQGIAKLKKEARTFRAIDLAFKLTPELYLDITTDLRVNYQLIAFKAVTALSNQFYSDLTIAQDVMAHFNITLNNSHPMIKDTIKKASIEALTTDPSEAIDSYVADVIEEGKKPEGKSQYAIHKEFNDLTDLGLDQPTIIKFLTDNYGLPKKEYNKVKLQARMKHSTHPTMVKLRKLTFTSFKVKETLTSDQILSRVSAIFIEVGKDVATTKDEATKFFNSMFETKESKRGSGKETTRYYTILSNR
jgi:hypothetical protein